MTSADLYAEQTVKNNALKATTIAFSQRNTANNYSRILSYLEQLEKMRKAEESKLSRKVKKWFLKKLSGETHE